MSSGYTLDEKYKFIKDAVIASSDKDPIHLLQSVMHKDFINIHGPEHHFLDGAAFMAALYNNGLDFNLEDGLENLKNRTIKMPGAMCGYWGICGAAVSIAAVFSIIDKTGPLSSTSDYKKHMVYTSKVISKMSKIGGPRCCKRNAFISVKAGIEYANKNYGLNIGNKDYICTFSMQNLECLSNDCPFNKNKQ